MLLNRFRWVYCQLEALRPCFPNNLRRKLEELPQSLDETYQRILKEINNANREQSYQLLQCLAVARRPLRVDELAEVLALDIDARGIPTFNANWRWEDHEAAVLSACSSLVSVVIDDGSRVVQFSHFSVKEFLTSDRLASMKDVSQFHIADEPSHLILAQACVGALLSVHDRTFEDSVKDIPLLLYADQYWGEHAHVGKVELRIQDPLDYLFDLDKPHFEALFRRGSFTNDVQYFSAPSDEDSDEDPKGVLTPAATFFFACQHRLRRLAERLIVSNQQQIIGFRAYGWPLLHWVVSVRLIEAARLLLAHGADINSRINYATQSPLELFVVRPGDNADEIENSLQISGADVSSEDSSDSNSDDEDSGHSDSNSDNMDSGFTPLHVAVSERNLGMCRMLLEHEADVHAQADEGITPLYLALLLDRLEIANILLEYTSEVNSKGAHGSTPLLFASESGSPRFVQLLLDRNADMHVRDDDGDTPLHCAAISGRLKVVQLLLGLNMEVNSRNNEGSTPLHLASAGYKKGNPDIVRLLLDHGADTRARNLMGKTASEVARGPKQHEIIQLLSERAAE